MIREALLTPNRYSRPQYAIRRVDAVVLHWVENPGSSADANRRYFESLKDGSRMASAHYVVDEREIVRCIPESEVAFHCGASGKFTYTKFAKDKWNGEHPNWYCLSIEHCHPDSSGRFTRKVLQRSHIIAAEMCLTYGLDPATGILLHGDIVNKDCPRWYVLDRQAFEVYKDAVRAILEVGL